jgi:phosphoribosyl-dephospho-CoA transferase
VSGTSFSLSYALELEEKLVARDAEVAALREQLEEAKAQLAAAKRPAVEEKAEAAMTLQHLLRSEEDVRRRAEQALEGYERWRVSSSRRAAPMT